PNVLFATEVPVELDALNERSGATLSPIDLRRGIAGALPEFVTASALRAIGLALVREPRIDLSPPRARADRALPAAGRGGLAVGPLLGALERLASPKVVFEDLDLKDDHLALHAEAMAEDGAGAAAARTTFVERLERSPLLANVGCDPQAASQTAPFRFHVEAA